MVEQIQSLIALELNWLLTSGPSVQVWSAAL